MVQFLQEVFDRYSHLENKGEIAKSMLSDLRSDLENMPPVDDSRDVIENLGKALDSYFKRKEYRYTIKLLENYIASGNFKTDLHECQDVYHPERYQRIEDFLTGKFEVLKASETSRL